MEAKTFILELSDRPSKDLSYSFSKLHVSYFCV